MSREGDLEKIKGIFNYVNHENIAVEENGVQNIQITQRPKKKLVDLYSMEHRRPPLMEAIIGGHTDVCKYLIIGQNANLEARDDLQNTALIVATALNNKEVLNILLINNANIKAQNMIGDHAAYLAAENGYLDILKQLLAIDGRVIDLKENRGRTPLIIASRLGRVDVVNFLVDQNANVDLRDDREMNALDHASDIEIIEILKKNGAGYH